MYRRVLISVGGKPTESSMEPRVKSVMEADVLVGRGVQLMQSGTGAHYYSNYDKRLRLIFKATVQTIISE